MIGLKVGGGRRNTSIDFRLCLIHTAAFVYLHAVRHASPARYECSFSPFYGPPSIRRCNVIVLYVFNFNKLAIGERRGASCRLWGQGGSFSELRAPLLEM